MQKSPCPKRTVGQVNILQTSVKKGYFSGHLVLAHLATYLFQGNNDLHQ